MNICDEERQQILKLKCDKINEEYRDYAVKFLISKCCKENDHNNIYCNISNKIKEGKHCYSLIFDKYTYGQIYLYREENTNLILNEFVRQIYKTGKINKNIKCAVFKNEICFSL